MRFKNATKKKERKKKNKDINKLKENIHTHVEIEQQPSS